uniref:Uncharacterized protein n=1 Tax=Florenciella parvula TaxID=236787 RepID=A0A7S2C170_9STRA|mmetsp:Transcript_2323/g.5191  ORF Transcript_2323/g.5191 Transcript_2323/m.5191 type:complete len:126 (+) Transcript_2323:3-380(+)
MRSMKMRSLIFAVAFASFLADALVAPRVRTGRIHQPLHHRSRWVLQSTEGDDNERSLFGDPDVPEISGVQLRERQERMAAEEAKRMEGMTDEEYMAGLAPRLGIMAVLTLLIANDFLHLGLPSPF